MTETTKDADSGQELVNLYGFASLFSVALYQNDNKEAKAVLRKALEHANRGDEYYFFLYSIKRGTDIAQITVAQGLIADYLQYEFERQIK